MTLDAALARYREVLGAESPDAAEIERFRSFLATHAGLGRLATAPSGADAAGLDRLRCFHFSQYLDWYLQEKEGLAAISVGAARAAMRRLNDWLFGAGLIGPEDFDENRESILGREDFSALHREEEAEEEAAGSSGLREEKDFHVPGEYSAVLSGEFVLTKVQEGILYGRRAGEREIGPILVERLVSGGHRIGDRVHLSIGKAGDHWNLLSIGPRQR